MDEDHAYIGIRDGITGKKPVRLLLPDRRQHVYIVGKTGTGKSTLLKNLILQDIHAGRGVGVIDPHGDLANSLLDQIPSRRSDDLVYFDPADHEHPIGLNLLPQTAPHNRHLVVFGVVSALKSIWRDSWGPRLEYILSSTVAALHECQNVSLLGVQRMLVDELYRRWVVDQVQDPFVKSYWTREFARYDKRFLAEAIAPVQNKIGQLLLARPLRNVLGQVKSKINLRFMMDKKRILIANLSKGKLGEDPANLLGALLINQFQLAAMSRSDTPEEERQDFSLYIDEFHSFTTEAFSAILAEARKYRLNLTLAHQHTAQLRPGLRDAVFGSVGTVISLRVGESDAKILEREFGGEYNARHFSGLSNFEMCIKTLSEGQSVRPFTAKALSPLPIHCGRREQLIRRSREKYSTKRSVVEDKIRRWMGPMY